MSVNVYRDGKVHVRAEQCDKCLFSKDRIVSRERAADIIHATLAESGPFVCHRHQVSDEPESICAVWYRTYGGWVPELRLAEACGIVERVAS